MLPPDQAVRIRDTWGGRSIQWLAWSVVAAAVLTKLVDGNVRVTLPSGAVENVSQGNVGGIVGVATFGVAVICAGLALVAKSRRIEVNTPFAGLMLLALAWWAICSILLRQGALDRQQLPYAIGGAVIAGGVMVSPPTMRTLHSLNLVRDLSAALMIAISALDPVNSQLECRSDKCGIFGSLYTGFFYTENSAALFILLLVPAMLTIRSSRHLMTSLLIVGIFLLATGSRTSLLDFLIVGTYVLIHRKNVATGGRGRPSILWRILPIGTLLASLVFLLQFSGSQLTGRGAIYAGIRSQLRGYALIAGSGPETMQRIFAEGKLGHFEAVGEHGQAPHLLVEGGVPCLILVGLALVTISVGRQLWSREQVAAFGLVVAASLQFATEPGWTLSARTMGFVTLVLATGLFRTVDRLNDDDDEAERKFSPMLASP